MRHVLLIEEKRNANTILVGKPEGKIKPCCGVPRGVWGVQTPPPEIPKALQNCVKLNSIVKTVKNC